MTLSLFRALGLAGRLTLALVAALLAGLVLWLIAGDARRDAAAARVGRDLSATRAGSAAAAAEIVAAGAARDAATDRLTQENRDAIDAAPGADLRLDPALNRAGRRGLCGYDAYRGRPECVQRTRP